MKLTPELIESGYQYINKATRDRELDLRGYKITVIENMGATLDQFDAIDFSDNDIRKLDGFPLLVRLKTLYLNNNRISRIADDLHESIPNLATLVMTNNHIQELGDIEPLAAFKRLECLSLLNNPITTKKHYRHYVIHKLPNVRVIDFRRVRERERNEAKELFKGSKGKQLEKEIGVKSKTFVPGVNETNVKETNRPIHTPAEVEAIKAAIAKAQTLEEIERLNQLLKSGYIPGRSDANAKNVQKTNQSVVEEEDDDMETTNSH